MREGNTERGFTLIELMLVVVIIGILAAVVIPSFMSAGTKSKARTESAAMFTEIAAKQTQYYAENSKYMGDPAGTNFVGTSTCPAAIPAADYVFATTCNTTGTAWSLLRIVATEANLRCQYAITTGLKGVTWTPPSSFKNSQGAIAAEPTPASSWFYMHARCDNSGSTGYSEYYASSVDRKIQRKNEGN